MTRFDPAQHPRTAAGTSTGGQFAVAPRAEAAVTLPEGRAANGPAHRAGTPATDALQGLLAVLPEPSEENPYSYDPCDDPEVDSSNLDDVVEAAVSRGWDAGERALAAKVRTAIAEHTGATVGLEPGRHTADCEAHAIGCAVQNIRDAKQDADAAARDWASAADPVTLGREYLEDGTATCYCASTDMAWASQWIDLGRLALDSHRASTDGPVPLERPMSVQEALAAAEDGFVTGTVAIDAEDLFAAIRRGAQSDNDEHDLLVGLLVDGATPNDSSYKVAGVTGDGRLLVEVTTGFEEPSWEQQEYESFLRDEAAAKARAQFAGD